MCGWCSFQRGYDQRVGPGPVKDYKSKAWLLSKLNMGWTYDQIAQNQGVDRSTVFRWVEKFGLKK